MKAYELGSENSVGGLHYDKSTTWLQNREKRPKTRLKWRLTGNTEEA
jgi:hypothetical protein